MTRMHRDPMEHRARLRPRRLLAYGLAALAVAALAVPLGSAGSTASSAAGVKVVNVKARDNGFTLSPKAAPVGTVRFVVRNVGKLEHNFRIAGKKTPVLAHGKVARLVVAFTKARKYPYVSTVRGDVRRGLKGTFEVTAPKPVVPGNPVAGRALFIAMGCNGCHTLRAANSAAIIGTNLDRAKPAYATIVKVVTAGRTGSVGTMPGFKGTLTTAQIRDLAAFIYTSTH